MGSKRGAATTAGIVDSFGYIGGILSGRYVGKLAEGADGWATAFGFLGAVCLATSLAAAVYWWVHESGWRRRRAGAARAPMSALAPVEDPGAGV